MTDLTPPLIHLSTTDSTNRYLRSISATKVLPSGSIVWADYQTAGRGQAGASWESEAGKNLYLFKCNRL
jgi:BirA family biotin operon repressor/biotin-[acetyl-CoA-carboxylase] ligase